MSRRSELLQEALLLEQLGSEWTAAHAAAVCTVSENYIYHSDCPRVVKQGTRSVKGRGRVRFIPADVKEWNDRRTQKAA